ncbi:hypothetical protein Aoki45_33000 [Algoriphagus sp. oki45]|uniref:GNAT family N-acetyltransferase n=1 Tax=Algoriphagus sp. oki45 TaxID=3067294 RepID=UPI0027EE43BE|nr:hypothetical protein Aoki45_33000 [Algoriphagus sp. oki45]
MQIRKGTPEDLPGIIDLLRISLGESLIPKSAELWQWKHENNPFGASPILLAEEGGQLVGIRAFLKWEYQYKSKTISACRAVDTAVHPDFQGKGIFTTLTLQLIEEIKKEGVDLIFNTPNKKSTPGYLKMGWEKWNRLPLQIGLNWNSFFLKANELIFSDWDSLGSIIEKLESQSPEINLVHTRLRPGYIFWRYRYCPLFPYHFVSDGENYLLIYRLKKNSWGKEFRICDFFIVDRNRKSLLSQVQKELKSIARSSGARWISVSGQKSDESWRLISSPTLPIGPLITLRDLGKGINPLSLPWAWSLGDLELF